MNPVNQKIVDAIIRKAENCCPGTLALIGVYGSVATGDTHEKSDLDLMLLVNDDRGYQLAEAFILADIGIGYDVYCTTWEHLESDAECNHAQLSKLLNSKLLYVGDKNALERLGQLQKKAKTMMGSEGRFQKAKNAFTAAKEIYAECMLTDEISEVRFHSAGVIHNLLHCVMLYHGVYFQKGVKRTFEEIEKLCLSFDMQNLILAVVRAETVGDMQGALKTLMLAVKSVLAIPSEKEAPSAENIAGTYEEIYSNWKNKMPEAAENGDVYSSFMNTVSFQLMLEEIGENVSIQHLDLLSDFDPRDLRKNTVNFDSALEQFLQEYYNVGIQPNVYKDIDEFLVHYLS